VIVDCHVHPVAAAQVHDPRHRAFMTEHASCLAQDDAVALLLERMDRGGIERACLMGPTHDDGISLANQDVRAIVERYPQRFVGFVGVDPISDGPEQVAAAIRTAVEDWGFRGVGELGGIDVLDPRCAPVFEACIRLRVPVVVHTGIGLPRFLLKHGTPLVVEELANRHPELVIVAAHAGVPWIAETVAVAVRNPNVWIDLSALPAANDRMVDAVVSLALSKGLEDRILFGSDFPVVDPARYVARVWRAGVPGLVARFLGLTRMSRRARDKILGENAARLLRL
jgi:predicted TIM-barrel fold metal-dependent hydrolase